MGKLTAVAVRGLTKPGRYADSAGLYLQVQGPAQKSWLFRYMRQGRARQMGLGPATGGRAVTLAEARERAREAHALLKEGLDPIEHRRARRAEAAARAPDHTFQAVAELYFAAHAPGWRRARDRAQWWRTLESHVFPHFGQRPVGAVDTGTVMAALEPIWHAKPETASRMRGRIEAVLDYAAARGWRHGENPARWRGHIAKLLPARSRVARVKHHAALPWRETGAFMVALRAKDDVAARALEFAILTATRSGEALGARWSEVDLDAGIWTVPAERMKGGREHRVPLSAAAIGLLRRMAAQRPPASGADHDPPVFPSPRPQRRASAPDSAARLARPLTGRALLKLLKRMGRSDLTAHGFRSTFRDWCAEATNHPREVAEAALAHALRDKVEAAYQRGDLLERRRRLMEEWAAYCARPTATEGVLDTVQRPTAEAPVD